MTTSLKRTTLLATSLAFGLFAALQLPQAVAQSEHEGHHPQNAPAVRQAPPKAPQGGMQNQGNMGAGQMPQGGMMDHSQMKPSQMMDHGSMDHEQMMKQMHEQHMGQGQMNHGNMPPAKTAPGTKDGKNGQ